MTSLVGSAPGKPHEPANTNIGGTTKNGKKALHLLNKYAPAMFNAVESRSRKAAFVAAWRHAQNPKVLARMDKSLANNGNWQILKEQNGGKSDAMMAAKFFTTEVFAEFGKGGRAKYLRGWWGVPFQFSNYPVAQMFTFFRHGLHGGAAGKLAASFMAMCLLAHGAYQAQNQPS